VAAVELHPDLEPLSFLLGRWRGEARSLWAGPEVAFGEDVTFEHFGKPSIAYRQRTWRVADGMPSHAESGYLSPKPGGLLVLTIAQPTGVVEVSTGTLSGTLIEVTAAELALAPDAKPVTAVARRVVLDEDGTLRYLLRIALNDEPLADHIAGELHRVES
jgi:hypothetical protein